MTKKSKHPPSRWRGCCLSQAASFDAAAAAAAVFVAAESAAAVFDVAADAAVFDAAVEEIDGIRVGPDVTFATCPITAHLLQWSTPLY